MNLTYTKVAFMHGACTEKDCPICNNGTIEDVTKWLSIRLDIKKRGKPWSPAWEAKQTNGDCYRALRGDLRKPGFYDQNPDAH